MNPTDAIACGDQLVSKTHSGRFFEDYHLGQVIPHPVPRTVSGGERALYHALYPARHALHSSDQFAKSCGLQAAPLDDLAVFHIAFGKSVTDISINAVANLGYAEGRWLNLVWPGDTLRSISQVIGLKENSNGKTGVVWVRTRTVNQSEQLVLEFVRWVMIRKRDAQSEAPPTTLPELATAITAEELVIPSGLHFSDYDFALAGEGYRWSDYQVGEQIDHVDRVTIEEADHLFATRLWQNTAKVHFDVTLRDDGRRLIYGGHIISLARSLSFNGLANAQMIIALNSGVHANPCFAGDTVSAWSEILDAIETPIPSVGALRIRLVATKGDKPFDYKSENGKYLPDTLLDLDYWALLPQ